MVAHSGHATPQARTIHGPVVAVTAGSPPLRDRVGLREADLAVRQAKLSLPPGLRARSGSTADLNKRSVGTCQWHTDDCPAGWPATDGQGRATGSKPVSAGCRRNRQGEAAVVGDLSVWQNAVA
ncbi:MAG: hypothetical protein R3F53_02530 [Gammaproteobacteria bacterium]